MRKLSLAASLGAVVLASLIAVSLSSGSSHREAPNIMLDPSADNTDLYAFTANDAQDKLTVVANWVPGGNPANGPNFFRFDDRARYYISIDNTGDGKADIRYRYVFKTKVSNNSYRQSVPGVQSFDDARLLQSQRYSIVREDYTNGKTTGERTIATDLPVAPGNAGPKSFPNYNKVANEAIRSVGDAKYFAGQRDDAFFIDLGAAFDVSLPAARAVARTRRPTPRFRRSRCKSPSLTSPATASPYPGPTPTTPPSACGPRRSDASCRSRTLALTATAGRVAAGCRSRAWALL
jgi:hypothetical protein